MRKLISFLLLAFSLEPGVLSIKYCSLDVFFMLDSSIFNTYQETIKQFINNITLPYEIANNTATMRTSVYTVGGFQNTSVCVQSITSKQSRGVLLQSVSTALDNLSGGGQFLNTTISSMSQRDLELQRETTVSIYITANTDFSDTTVPTDISHMFNSQYGVQVYAIGINVECEDLLKLGSQQTQAVSSESKLYLLVSDVTEWLANSAGFCSIQPDDPTTTANTQTTPFVSTTQSTTLNIGKNTTLSFTTPFITTSAYSTSTLHLISNTTVSSINSATNATLPSTTMFHSTTQQSITSEKTSVSFFSTVSTTANHEDKITTSSIFLVLPTTPGLSNLTQMAFDSSNATVVLNSTLQYANPSMQPGDLNLFALMLQRAAVLNGITQQIILGILQNIDGIMSAERYVFRLDQETNMNSSQIILQTLIQSVQSGFVESVNFLNGNNLAYIMRTNSSHGIGLSDQSNKFSVIPSVPSNGNSIFVPEDVLLANLGSKVVLSIFKNDKLFVGSKPVLRVDKHGRPVPYDKFSSDYAIMDNPPPIKQQRCELQNYLADELPIMASTIVSNTFGVQKPNSGVMAQMSWNVKDQSPPLHGKYKVTWWDTKRLKWSNEDQCDMRKSGSRIIAQCGHLTDFTVIVDGVPNDPIICNKTLNIIGTVVNALSIFCLFLYIVVIISVRIYAIEKNSMDFRMKKEQELSKFQNFRAILYQALYTSPIMMFIRDFMVISLFIFFTLFTIFNNQDVVGNACQVIAAISYTSLLWAFELNGIFAFSLIIITNLTDLRRLNPRDAAAIGVLLTIAIAGTLLASILLSIFTEFFDRGDQFCWIRSDEIWQGMVIPILIMTLTVFICIGQLFYRRTRKTSTGENNLDNVLDVFIIAISMGVPWLLDFLTIGWPKATAWHYLFTIMNGSQGTITFLMMLRKLQKTWKAAEKQHTITRTKLIKSNSVKPEVYNYDRYEQRWN